MSERPDGGTGSAGVRQDGTAPLLEVEGLRTWIDGGTAVVRAVDSATLELVRGETLALLGESGCGKSMTALSIMRLLPDAAEVVGGSVRLDGEDLLDLPEHAMRAVRGARIGMIFQEPMLSLNPVMRVGLQVEEALHRHRRMSGARHAHARWNCCRRSASRMPYAGSTSIRSSSPAACASG